MAQYFSPANRTTQRAQTTASSSSASSPLVSPQLSTHDTFYIFPNPTENAPASPSELSEQPSDFTDSHYGTDLDDASPVIPSAYAGYIFPPLIPEDEFCYDSRYRPFLPRDEVWFDETSPFVFTDAASLSSSRRSTMTSLSTLVDEQHHVDEKTQMREEFSNATEEEKVQDQAPFPFMSLLSRLLFVDQATLELCSSSQPQPRLFPTQNPLAGPDEASDAVIEGKTWSFESLAAFVRSQLGNPYLLEKHSWRPTLGKTAAV